MTVENNKIVVKQFLQRLAGQTDPALIGQFVSPAACAHYPGALVATMVGRAFADFRVELRELLAAEDAVVCRMVWSGTHKHEFAGIAATGRVVEGQLVNTFRLAEGKIVEAWQSWDLASLLRELRALPVEPV